MQITMLECLLSLKFYLYFLSQKRKTAHIISRDFAPCCLDIFIEGNCLPRRVMRVKNVRAVDAGSVGGFHQIIGLLLSSFHWEGMEGTKYVNVPLESQIANSDLWNIIFVKTE